jgi:hypothetical protein
LIHRFFPLAQLQIRKFAFVDTIQPNCAVLPSHGRIACSLCHRNKPFVFDETRTESEQKDWRITANPLAWGNQRPEVLVLGFSKGPSQANKHTRLKHNDIPYRKGRPAVAKILAHVGLLPSAPQKELERMVEHAIADRNGRFGWGSLIRCTVERFAAEKGQNGDWVASSKMIDPFMATDFGQKISTACATRFLRELPIETKLVIMFGRGAKNSYVMTARKTLEKARPGIWREVNEIAYTDGAITVVHVEHFASQGAHIPNWLGKNENLGRLGVMARDAVEQALAPKRVESAI